MNRLAAFAGLAAPLIYAVTVIVGGWITPTYSQLNQPVSALIAVGAPNALTLGWAFTLYNLLALGFAVGLFFYWNSKTLRISAVAIGLTGILGLIMSGFPMDAPGLSISVTGIVHLTLAALLSLGTMAAMLFATIGWRQSGNDRATIPTDLALILVLLSGVAAVLFTAQNWPFSGLFERIAIGTYLCWLLAVALGVRRAAA